ncbi:hypothetical protein ACRAWG_25490 [Methylobacterium sp. P31]
MVSRLIIALFAVIGTCAPCSSQNFPAPGMISGAPKITDDFGHQTISVLPTPSYWTSDAIPARIIRLNDRVLIGKEANKWDGAYRGIGADFTWTMGRGNYAYLPRNAELIVTNPYSEIGALFASRTGDSASLPGIPQSACCAIGAATLILNDNKTTVQPAWNWYATGVRLPGTGDVLNGEFDVLNATQKVVRAPVYGANPTGISMGLALNAGGEGAPYNNPSQPPFPQLAASTAALMVMGNGSTFDKGILIKSASISPTADGSTVAIDMPANNLLRWAYDNTDATGGYVTSSVSNISTQIGLELTDNGALFKNRIGTIFAQVNLIPGAVNRPVLSGAIAGQPVQLAAIGTDANVDVQIAPKGAGRVFISSAVVTGHFQMPLHNASQLPPNAPIGSAAYCSDCREPGQAHGAGTGMLVFKNASGWRSAAGGAILN